MHQVIGWSAPMDPPEYVDSSNVASTLAVERGLVRKLYHSSVRTQVGPRCAVAACARFSIRSVACWMAGCEAK